MSIAGRSGLNTRAASGEIPQQCGNRPLSRVEVRRDFAQGLATVLSLGIVNPATIHFSCAKPGQTPVVSCETIEGTGGGGIPTQIRCTKNATGDDPETVDFDCSAKSDPATPDRISEFTCKAVDTAWFGQPVIVPGPQRAEG